MADALEEKPSTSPHFDSAKIFNTIKQFGKWREDQYQEFRKKHLEETEKILGLHKESYESIGLNGTKCPITELPKIATEEIQKVTPLRSDASSSSLGNYFDDTLQESSITGHLQRCFDDSSQNSLSINPNKVPSVPEKIPIFSEIRNLQFLKKYVNEKEEGLVKVANLNDPQVKKRPFLRKGAGLLRFTREGAAKIKETRKKVVLSESENPPIKTIKLPQKHLKLKPAIRKTDVPSEPVKRIRFHVPFADHETHVKCVVPSTLSPDKKLMGNTEVTHDEGNESLTQSPSSAPLELDLSDRDIEEQPNVRNESFSSESKELAEFEMLENCAQNSSFNSDSSMLQRIIHGNSNNAVCSNQKEPETVKSNMNPILESHRISVNEQVIRKPSESSAFPVNIGFESCRKEVEARKQELENIIADIRPRIKSLENEAVGSRVQFRTLPEDLETEERILSPPLPENEINECSSDIQLSPNSFPNPLESRSRNTNMVNLGRIQEDAESEISENEEESTLHVPDDLQANEQALDGKSKLSKKLAELQGEIDTYHQLNARLSTTVIEKTELLRKLQKDRDDFQKYKENERKKLEAEIKEERRQLKRQKESFTRLQKLSKDHPTRKEREELNALRQEIEKLQEDLKRQNLRYSSESRKWKTRIEIAEKDRDIMRLENIKLEEQVQDLLAALKPRMKKSSETKVLNFKDENEVQNKLGSNSIPEKKHVETQTDECSNFSDSKESSKKTTESVNIENNSKIAPEHEKKESEIPINNIDSKNCPKENFISGIDSINVIQKNLQNITKDPLSDNLSVITVSADAEFNEIKYENRVERIHATGEREIIFNSGTRKLISADRKSIKFFFYNGDVKEVIPGKHEVYRYVNGVTETTFPDGLIVTKFLNGQTQHHYPDGKKEIKFPNGANHIIYADGSEKILSANGNITTTKPDGTKIINLANGQIEIRTETYKRREFPNGSVKVIFKDGREETRYSDGRVRMKDREGKIIFDTKYVSVT